MKDKEYNQAKAKIKKYIKKWMCPLGLLWWETKIEYYDQSSAVYKSDSEVLAAETHVSWFYGHALIKFYVPEFLEQTDKNIERMVVHELCHIIVNQMRECGSGSFDIKHEELVVTNLTKAFLWTYEAGVNEGKKPTKKVKNERSNRTIQTRSRTRKRISK